MVTKELKKKSEQMFWVGLLMLFIVFCAPDMAVLALFIGGSYFTLFSVMFGELWKR